MAKSAGPFSSGPEGVTAALSPARGPEVERAVSFGRLGDVAHIPKDIRNSVSLMVFVG